MLPFHRLNWQYDNSLQALKIADVTNCQLYAKEQSSVKFEPKSKKKKRPDSLTSSAATFTAQLNEQNCQHMKHTSLKVFYMDFTCIIISVEISPEMLVTSWWARWRLKSRGSWVFTQPFVQAQIKEKIKAPRQWPLWGEFTGDRWIPRTKGQWRGKCFHFMTSSRNHGHTVKTCF